MAKRRSPDKPSDREKRWNKIFNALVKMCQNLQNQRQSLEERVHYLNGCIYKIKMEQKVDSLKAELMVGLKERDSIVYKHRCENTVNDLDDLREWCDYLVQKCSGSSDISMDISNEGEQNKTLRLRDEVRKLKSELEEYKVEKSSEISALLAEKTFVWNQLKQMETTFKEKLRKKCDEVKNANEKVQILVSRADELQKSNEDIRADMTKMESESIRKDQEILELMKEVERLKSRSGSALTVLRPCKADAASSSRRGNRSSASIAGSIAKEKESDPSQTTDKMTRTRPRAHKSTGGKAPRKRFMQKGSNSSKSKAIVVTDTPKLFTSSFKVPKLKN